MCLYGLGLLPILSIGFMVEPQFHHGIRARLSTCEAQRPRALHVIQLLSTCTCEAQRPHTLHVIQLLSTCRLENPSHVRGRVESCPTLVRNKVCYVLIWFGLLPILPIGFRVEPQFHQF